MMKSLGERYVPEFNRRHERTGTLWEGRFRSSIVDSERYLICCQQYIELNPVRARHGPACAADYPWSSFRSNALGEALDPAHCATLSSIPLGHGHDSTQRALSGQLFASPFRMRSWKRIRAATNSGGFALGRPCFIADAGRAPRSEAAARLADPGRPRRKLTPGRVPLDALPWSVPDCKGSFPGALLSMCWIAARSSWSSLWVAAILDLARSRSGRWPSWTIWYWPPLRDCDGVAEHGGPSGMP